MDPKCTRLVEDDPQEDESEDGSEDGSMHGSEDESGDGSEDESENPQQEDYQQQVPNLTPKLFPSLICAKLGVGHCNNMALATVPQVSNLSPKTDGSQVQENIGYNMFTCDLVIYRFW